MKAQIMSLQSEQLAIRGMEKATAIKTIWTTNFSSGPGINSQTPQYISVATLC
jgi:hypothetical protein